MESDATNDDPTIKRCINFVKIWGGSSLLMVNIFAYRSTKPDVLRSVIDPISEFNDMWLARVVDDSDGVVAAWGNNRIYKGRSQAVIKIFYWKLQALSFTKLGMPSHPLYVPANTELSPFS